ncbi:MAG: tRNA (guanosine(37)-N1)-methyltransferase TrmD [Firmicutes bacterium]|nr:tRNA (guanosine(37)-N1)-methyltransferase TrmD [Bacillota bacterium]
MKVNIFTLFPQMFVPLQESIMKRAQDKKIAEINVHNIRDYAADPHFADDLVYGGGAGMVMKPEPIMNALRQNDWEKGKKVVVTTPAGKTFTQREAVRLAKEDEIFFIAGHYEGFDQRVVDITEAEEFSIGDYVLTGGELPAMVMTDSIVRLLEGVLGDSASLDQESFTEGLLEYPQYTRPRIYEDREVPEVLFCGDHKVVDKWRHEESIRRTYQNRPDLLRKLPLDEADQAIVNELHLEKREKIDLYIALVHYPVLDPKGHVIATSVTNLDIHDIARLSRTYNVKGYYIVQPGEEQKELTERLVNYWSIGHGSKINPDRKAALSLVSVVDSLEDAESAIEEKEGNRPLWVGTSAKIRPNIVGYDELRDVMEREDRAFLLVFGTGHGMTSEIMDRMDYVLKPIIGRGEYNHLSVRSAVSIILDRLIGE